MKENETEITAADALLRRVTMEDLPDVAQIHRRAFFTAMPHMPVLHTPEEDLNFYSTGVYTSSEMWLAEVSDVIVGFIAFREGWLDHLYIQPRCQRHGIGSSLLARAQDFSETLRAWVFKCNTGARHFYENHGFEVEKETDGSGNEEKQPDVLYVWKRKR
jgi:ribosomal protein S18 acetylase RimI-like enzyme